LLEATASYLGVDKVITAKDLQEVHQKGMALYDKDGEEHYNLISALHKSLRGGDPDASPYWLARMLDGGEHPLYIVRRLVRFASEDIGLADPYALTLAIAQLVIYLACAPKSNSAYIAFDKALEDAKEKGSLPVPLYIRNAQCGRRLSCLSRNSARQIRQCSRWSYIRQ
jgi:putative ATPase